MREAKTETAAAAGNTRRTETGIANETEIVERIAAAIEEEIVVAIKIETANIKKKTRKISKSSVITTRKRKVMIVTRSRGQVHLVRVMTIRVG